MRFKFLSFLFLTLIFFIFCNLFHSAHAVEEVDRLITRADELELSKDKQWLNLVHYRRRFGSGYKSQADGFPFFLAGKKGMTDPKAELEATLRSFFEPPSLDTQSHSLCRFPARYQWLKSKLLWDEKTVPQVSCSAYDEFRQRVDAHSATLVFSSYYLNNPSSAYGHTLLRLNKAPSSISDRRYELLDHGINYSAVMTTKNPILYAIMGLTGMFKGTFTNIPYYYKVREYNDFESRDLWEYDLNLTPEEVQMLVAHIWELGSTYFDYYYITENCSYHMLTLLEAAAPRYSLTDKLSFYVIPTDTLKVVNQTPGLVSNIHYRPSILSQFKFRLEHLSKEERELLAKMVTQHQFTLPQSLELERKAALLDAATDYVDFKYGDQLLKLDEKALQFKQDLLLNRSQLDIVSPPLDIPLPEQEAPHEGHGSARTGLSAGFSSQLGPYIRLSHRFALHDLLDPQTGYPSYMEIDFVKVDLRYNTRDHSVWPENIDLIDIFSLSDFNQFQKSISWKLRVGSTVFRDNACFNCLGGIAEGGAGLTKQFGPLWTTLTVDAEISGSPDFEGSDVRLRFGPMAQIRATFLPTLQMLIRSEYRHSVVPDFSSNLESTAGLRWEFVKNVALDLQFKQFWHPEFLEGGAGFYVYY